MNQHPTHHSNELRSPRLPSSDSARHLPGGHYHSGEIGAHHTHWNVDANATSRQLPPIGNLLHVDRNGHPGYPAAMLGSNTPFAGHYLDPNVAAMNQPRYQLPPAYYPAPAVASSRVEEVPDRTLHTPLPPDDDDDPPAPLEVLQRVAHPATKRGGARQMGPTPQSSEKARQRAASPGAKAVVGGGKRKAAVQSGPVETKKSKGRAAGSSNYSDDDLTALFSILDERLPLAGRAWNTVTDLFNEWALEHGRPARASKSLEAKFKQLAKQKKPTGDAEVPQFVARAWMVEEAMNEKAGSRDLDDEEFAEDAISVSSDDEENHKENKAPAESNSEVKAEQKGVKTEKDPSLGPVVRRPANDRLPQAPPRSRARANEALLANLTNTLDPAAQAARAEDRAARSLQTTQILSLTSQLREAQGTIEGLRTQLADAERRCAAAERRADKLEMMEMIHRGRSQFNSPSPRRSRYYDTPPHRLYSSSRRFSNNTPRGKTRRLSNSPPAQRSSRHSYNSPRTIRYDIDYPDGGQAVTFYHPDLDSPINPDRYPEGTRIIERWDMQEGFDITMPSSTKPHATSSVSDTTSCETHMAQTNEQPMVSTFVAEAFDEHYRDA
ncbi:hypothetical protein EST38_g7134 [Candolleomyces aberdarensis]|uniref:DUF6818 domain-containing protein n=1 Tax=Candolleomyces aberdarensis TaxID=2316362 RepID=A0A4V1Q3I6_9AGAR|nr:hypothetical protein EST38_g7134 [Candolleomyces aberdarensis]